MKNILLFAIVLFTQIVYSQDSVKVKQIDSLVKLINNSGYKVQNDTLKQEQPAMGFSSQTYLSMLTDGGEVKKYVNDVHMTMKNNGTTRKVHATNTFYFNNNKLIKAVDFMVEGDNKKEVDWYFSNDKPIYNTPKSEKGQERAEFLLKIAQDMLDKMKLPG